MCQRWSRSQPRLLLTRSTRLLASSAARPRTKSGRTWNRRRTRREACWYLPRVTATAELRHDHVSIDFRAEAAVHFAHRVYAHAFDRYEPSVLLAELEHCPGLHSKPVPELLRDRHLAALGYPRLHTFHV